MKYALTITFTRVLPIFYALAVLINANLYYFEILPKLSFVLRELFYHGWVTVIASFVYSITYKFCLYHQLFIFYITINKLLILYDKIIGISLNDYYLYILFLTIAGVFMIAIVLAYLKFGDRNIKR